MTLAGEMSSQCVAQSRAAIRFPESPSTSDAFPIQSHLVSVVIMSSPSSSPLSYHDSLTLHAPIHCIGADGIAFIVGGGIATMSLSTRKQTLIAVAIDETVTAISTTTLRRSDGNAAGANTAIITAAVCSADRAAVLLYAYPKRQLIARIECADVIRFNAVALTHNGAYIAAVTESASESRIYYFDAKTSAVIGRFRTEIRDISAANFSAFANNTLTAVTHTGRAALFTFTNSNSLTKARCFERAVADDRAAPNRRFVALCPIAADALVLLQHNGALDRISISADASDGIDFLAADSLHALGISIDDGAGTESDISDRKTVVRPPLTASAAYRPDDDTTKTAAIVTSLTLSRYHLICGTDDGRIVWMNIPSPSAALLIPAFQQQIDAAGSKVLSIAFTAAFDSLITLTSVGAVRYHKSSVDVKLRDNNIRRIVAADDDEHEGNVSPAYATSLIGHFPLSHSIERAAPIQYGVALVPATDSSVRGRRCIMFNEFGAVVLWAYASRSLIAQISLGAGVTAVKVSDDGAVAVFGLSNGVLAVVDCASAPNKMRLVFARQLTSDGSPVVAVAFSSSSHLIAALTRTKIYFIRAGDLTPIAFAQLIPLINDRRRAGETDSGRAVSNLSDEWPITDSTVVPIAMTLITFPAGNANPSATDRAIIATSDGAILTLTAPTSLAPLVPLCTSEDALIPTLSRTPSPALALCVMSGGDIVSGHSDGALRRWKYADKYSPLKLVREYESAVGGAITAVSTSADGRYIAHSGAGGILSLRDGETLEISTALTAHSPYDGGCHSVVVDRDGAYVISAGIDGAVAVWQTDATQIPIASTAPTSVSSVVLHALTEVHDTLAATHILAATESDAADIDVASPPRSAGGTSTLQRAFEDFTANYRRTLEKNERLPPEQRLSADELAVDRSYRQSLIDENRSLVADERARLASAVQRSQSECERLLSLCWSTSTVKGQTIRAMRSPAKRLSNFPTRKASAAEIALTSKLLFLRRMQLLSERYRRAQSADEQSGGVSVAQMIGATEYVRSTGLKRRSDSGDFNLSAECDNVAASCAEDLLYNPLDCVTSLRQRLQLSLLAQTIQRKQSAFNGAVDALLEDKLAALALIQEKSARIGEISRELKLDATAALAVPTALADDEISDSAVNVRDEELTAVNPRQERRGVELTAEEALSRAIKARGLEVMMNSTMSVNHDVVSVESECPREEWMDLPLAQMSDEQRIALGKYDKRVKFLEMEREVRKKLLLSEFNRLRTEIADVSKSFDVKFDKLCGERLALRNDVLMSEYAIIAIRRQMHERMMNATRLLDLERDVLMWTVQSKKCASMAEYARHNIEQCSTAMEVIANDVRGLEKKLKSDMIERNENYDHLVKVHRIRRWKQSQNGASNTQNSARNSIIGGSAHPRRQSLLGGRVSRMSVSLAAWQNADLNGHRRKRSSYMGGGSRNDESDHKNGAGALSLDPYASAIESTEILCDVDRDVSVGDVAIDVWRYFVDAKKVIQDKERIISELNDKLTDLKAHAAALNETVNAIRSRLTTLNEARTELSIRCGVDQLNTVLVVALESGSVEMDNGSAQSSLSLHDRLLEMRLLHRGSVESLNVGLLSLGREKLAAIEQCAAIGAVNERYGWELAVSQLTLEDQIDMTRQLQCLRVTRPLQRWIAVGGLDGAAAIETKQVERKRQFVANSSRESAIERQMAVLTLKKRANNLKTDNARLRATISHLESAVEKREAVVAIIADSKAASSAAESNRMKALVQRRRLVDLSELQSSELDWMQNELERLRRRTFASFTTANRTHKSDDKILRTSKRRAECKESGDGEY